MMPTIWRNSRPWLIPSRLHVTRRARHGSATTPCYHTSRSRSVRVALHENDGGRVSSSPVSTSRFLGQFSFVSLACLWEWDSTMLLKIPWQGSYFLVVISSSVNRTSHLEALRKGMETWENNTCVKFVKRTNELRYARIFYGSKG